MATPATCLATMETLRGLGEHLSSSAVEVIRASGSALSMSPATATDGSLADPTLDMICEHPEAHPTTIRVICEAGPGAWWR